MNRLLLLTAFLLVSACDTAVSQAPTVSPALADALDIVLLDEYRAEAIYARVIDDFGEVRPFVNIIGAEQRHASSLEALYAQYGLDRPANPHTAAAMSGFASVSAACLAGVEAEIDNASLYDEAFRLEMPDDVRRVITSNRDASLNNHLPAFERCASS